MEAESPLTEHEKNQNPPNPNIKNNAGTKQLFAEKRE